MVVKRMIKLFKSHEISKINISWHLFEYAVLLFQSWFLLDFHKPNPLNVVYLAKKQFIGFLTEIYIRLRRGLFCL